MNAVWEVCEYLTKYYGKGRVVDKSTPNMVHENTLLSLDVTKAYRMLQWKAMLNFYEAIEYTVDWYKEALNSNDMFEFSKQQIKNHMAKGYMWEE